MLKKLFSKSEKIDLNIYTDITEDYNISGIEILKKYDTLTVFKNRKLLKKYRNCDTKILSEYIDIIISDNCDYLG